LSTARGAKLELNATEYFQTPLWKAAEDEHADIVKLLSEEGAELKLKDT